jgi:uncharacterized caspase-like protein
MLARLMMLLAVVVAALLPAGAQAERRVALVVGNSAYKHAATLRNPGNDANDVAGILKNQGFEVLLATDLDQQDFARTIEKFARLLDEADVALFFYAGHGLQVNEKNYLVSVNARLENEFLLSSETMELDSIVRLMESKTAVNLVFLDACRNNPLAENLRRSLTATKRGAQLGRGLARMEVSGRDTLVAFAAGPGQEASDGAERNSPFTGALLRHLPKPGLEVSVMLKEVAADVRRDTRGSQRPQQLSDMTKTFYFAKAEPVVTAKIEPPAAPSPVPAAPPLPPAPPAAATSGDDRALDMAYWNAVQSSNDCEAVRAYLRRFPQGLFVELAKLSETRLCTAGRQAVVPVPAGPQTSLNLASVPPSLPGTVPPESALARDVQRELVRLGCVTGDAKDTWTPQAKEAIRKFNRYAHARLEFDRPSAEMVSVLRGHDTRVCPLECGRGMQARGDACVAVDRAEPPKSRKAEPSSRERERDRKRKEASHTPAERPVKSRAEKPAPSGTADLGHPLCTSRMQMPGGKWCCSYDPPRGATVIICR